jgi:ribonuclease HII
MPTRPPPGPISSLTLLCGVDEAGRGPLAGAVYAAAVVLDPARPRINGLADSKVLTEAVREQLASRIRERSLAWAVASASVEEIDSINILRASLLAMKRAVEALGMEPEEVCVDGLHTPQVSFKCRAIVRGDSLVKAISAASILAKTARDAEMRVMDKRYPAYGFANHKGYPTPEHLAALKAHGPCEIHRRSFEPVQVLLQEDLPF